MVIRSPGKTSRVPEPLVWLPAAIAEKMVREANAKLPFETGGVLLGYAATKTEIVIAELVGPGPNAAHLLEGFTPDYRFHETEVARCYERSGRQHQYIGDWHSHPDGALAMSRTDRKALRNIAKAKDARVANPIMLIIAGWQQWKAAAWQLYRQQLRHRLVVSSIRIF
jgi:integrative and conjugative element protein (TIGR02256 family)